MDLFLLVLVLSVGFAMGYLSKGITVNINSTPDIPLDEEGKPQYNEPIVDNLDPEVRQWYETNNGHKNF